ncbi:MAG: CoA transferase [Acidimicrobiales bacterium]
MSTSVSDGAPDVEAWAASGAMAITGRPGRPQLGPPAPLVSRLGQLAQDIGERSAELGCRLEIDPLSALAERAALSGLERGGTTSCGGSTRLLRCLNDWLAVGLVRETDVEAVPAWLELPGDPVDVWATVGEVVAGRPAGTLVERARLLGLPVARLGSVDPRPWTGGVPARARRIGSNGWVGKQLERLVVVDLSSLWAGPLCTRYLAAAGARVIKVEARGRPDGARRGPEAFFDLMNGEKESVALELPRPDAVSLLEALLRQADVVVEASRPRALEQLGIVACDLVATGGPSVWVSITGYGRDGPGRDAVAFGDDAAVAGGLVVSDPDGPCFCGDAIADPVAGLVALAATLDALASGGHWLIDVSMADAAAHIAGATLGVPAGITAARPLPPRLKRCAPDLGADTEVVLHDLGVWR